MATFNEVQNNNHDDYMTPKYAWEQIKEYIPKDLCIWEAFYGDGKSGKYLRELGFKVIQGKIENGFDFFKEDYGQMIVTNPPFSMVSKIMPRLLKLDKPFILLMPISKITTKYFRIFKDKNIQMIIPPKRIAFNKLVNGKVPDKFKSSPNQACVYFCYKCDLNQDITFLD